MLLLQVNPGWMKMESKGAAYNEVVEQFKEDYFEVQAVTAPGTCVVLDISDLGLSVSGERALALTIFGMKGCFVVRVDWRALLSVPPPIRRLVAVHEACHLRHVVDLKSHIDLTPGRRHLLEADANRCATLYLASRTN
jgi:hypothetical protein